MQLTSTQQKLYRANLYEVINEGVEGPQDTSKVIAGRVIRSRQAYEEFLTHTGLGLFVAKGEGENATMDRVRTRFNPTYTPVIYELGVEYSKQAKHKDIYGFISAHGKMLADSWVMTRNYNAAMLLQLGFSGGTNLTPDGLTLFNSAHTLATGATQSNAGTADMSSLNLAAGVEAVMGQLGDRGLPATNFPTKWRLIVPPQLWGSSNRAVRSNQINNSNDNDTNAHLQEVIEGAPVVERFIGFNDSSFQDCWFLLPSEASKNPLFRLAVADMDTRVDQEVRSGNIVMVASAEELHATIGWRGTYGSNP